MSARDETPVALTPDDIRARIEPLSRASSPAPEGLRHAAVLVLLSPTPKPPRDDGAPRSPEHIRVLLLERAATMRHHAGQLALPGGAREPADRDLAATALREANEEVGLPPGFASLLGRLTPQPTSSGFWMTPFVSWDARAWTPRPGASGEVARLVQPTLARLAAPRGHRVRGHWTWRGRQLPRHELLVGSCDPPITGATGRALWELLTRLSLVTDDRGAAGS